MTNTWILKTKGHTVLFPSSQKYCKNQTFTVIQSPWTFCSHFNFLLDYNNSIFTCVSQSSIARLQLAALLLHSALTKTSRRSHIIPILAIHHWLAVKFRIHFKILLLTYKALHGQAPAYITEILRPFQCSRPFPSSKQCLLNVIRFDFKTRDHAFEVVAPKLRNSFPQWIGLAHSVISFKWQRKTYFYRLAFP